MLVVVAAMACAGSAFYTGGGISRGWADRAQRTNAARLAPIVDWVRASTPIQQGAADLRSPLQASGADFAVLSGRAADLDFAAQLRDGPDFPRLIPIDTLHGGGVAFRVDRGR